MPAIEGEPARGFQIGRILSDPATVEVMGPESRLRQVIEATTEPVSVDNAAESVQAIVTVGVPDPTLRLLVASTATVTVEIEAGPIARIIAGVPVQSRRLGAGLEVTLTPDVVTLVIRGPRERVDDLTAESILAYVELGGLGPGEFDVPIETTPLADVVLERAEPPDIHVRIQ